MLQRLIALLPALALLLPAAAPADQAPSRPNVLLILVDDLRPSLGVYGDKHVISPNLDNLANRGMRFDMAYCNQAVCAPSRNHLLTSTRSTTSGIHGFSKHFRKVHPDAVTLPQYFMQHGYRAEGIGKVFHIGHGLVGDDASWSVPFVKESPIEYLLPESTQGGQLTREEAFFNNQFPPGGVRQLPRGAAWEAPDVADDAYADGRIAREGVRRLQAAKDRDEPFFLVLGFTKPHLPFCAPKTYWDLYDPAKLPLATYTDTPEGAPPYAGKGPFGEIGNFFPCPQTPDELPFSEELQRKLVHGYYASLSYMDAQVGLVLEELDRLELSDNTIIVLWGDHGYHLGDHGTWTKHTNYELDTHIPICIVAPGITAPASSTQAFIETVDIYPTLAELAGLPAPTGPQPIDGISQIAVLKDPSTSVRDYAYHCYPRGQRIGRAIRTEQYRMVEWKVPGEPASSAEYELYDYTDGVVEKINLADQRPEVLEQHKAILEQLPEARH